MANNTFNYPLYYYAVGWWGSQPENPLTFIAPIVKADGMVGTFKRYPQSSVFRSVDTRRALYGQSSSIDLQAEDVPFVLEDHSLNIPVDDTEIARYGNKAEAADQAAQAKMGSLLGTWKTSFIKQGFDKLRKDIVATSGGNWSAASADPIAELRAKVESFVAQNGVYPNRILMGLEAWNILAKNAQVKDIIAFNRTKTLTTELLLESLGLVGGDIGQEVKVLRSIIPVGADLPGVGVPFNGAGLVGSECWLTYADEGQSIGDISGAKTLTTGGENIVENVESYYVREKKTTYYECSMFRQFVVSAPSAISRFIVS